MQNSTPSKRWYDNGLLVFILLLFVFPVGLYALWKGNAYSRTSKFVLTFFVLAAVAAYFDSDKSSANSAYSGDPNAEFVAEGNSDELQSNTPSETLTKVGEELSVGNFTYRVNESFYKKSIGNDFLKEKADGIFLVVQLSLMNLDKEAHTIDNSLFKLTDANGTEFESSNEGSMAMQMSGEETLFLKQCNPNIQKEGYLVFEVPTRGSYNLHLSGGYWSGSTGVVALASN